MTNQVTKPLPLLKKKHSALFRFYLRTIVKRCLSNGLYGKESHALFANSISGVFPSGDVILAACDDNYFHLYAEDLMRSMERLQTPHALHLLLLNPSSEVIERVKRLTSSLKNVRLTHTIDPCLLAAGFGHPPIYFTAARFILAPLLLEKGVRRLLMIDVDAVMNNSPWPFFNEAANSQIGSFIFRLDKKQHWYRILASAVFLNESSGSRRLASAMARAIVLALGRKPRYHIDQIIPYYVCDVAKGRSYALVTSDIPPGLVSYTYEPEAAIWTVKGKSNVDQFLEQRNKMLNDG